MKDWRVVYDSDGSWGVTNVDYLPWQFTNPDSLILITNFEWVIRYKGLKKWLEDHSVQVRNNCLGYDTWRLINEETKTEFIMKWT